MKDDLRKLSFKLKDAEFYISDLKTSVGDKRQPFGEV